MLDAYGMLIQQMLPGPATQWQTSYAALARLPGGPNTTADPMSADADGQPRHARAGPQPNPELGLRGPPLRAPGSLQRG